MTYTTSLQCYLCGNEVGVQEENILTLAGTVKNVGMCMDLKACNARLVKAVQEKALASRPTICGKCGASEQVWFEVFHEPHQPCSAPTREELGK